MPLPLTSLPCRCCADLTLPCRCFAVPFLSNHFRCFALHPLAFPLPRYPILAFRSFASPMLSIAGLFLRLAYLYSAVASPSVRSQGHAISTPCSVSPCRCSSYRFCSERRRADALLSWSHPLLRNALHAAPCPLRDRSMQCHSVSRPHHAKPYHCPASLFQCAS